jgi:hypothetical protein
MIIYKEREKLRAEAYKNIGYFWGSISGLTIINIFVYGKEFSCYCNWTGIIILGSIFLSYYFVGIGAKILAKLDEDIANHR